MKIVLIDTWWNVNKDHRIAISNQNKGFNRYMVECEFESVEKFGDFDTSFNRYMVECESFEYYINSFSFTVLIDTWWNVNFQSPGIAKLNRRFNRYMVECEFYITDSPFPLRIQF